MNWRRGIFRLWVLASLLWIGGAATFVAVSPDWTFTTQKFVAKANAPPCKPSHLETPHELTDAELDCVLDNTITVTVADYRNIGSVIVLGLSAPVLLLLLGFFTRWVYLGFAS